MRPNRYHSYKKANTPRNSAWSPRIWVLSDQWMAPSTVWKTTGQSVAPSVKPHPLLFWLYLPQKFLPAKGKGIVDCHRHNDKDIPFNMDEKAVIFSVADESKFEQLYKEYYKALYAYAFSMLRDEYLAEEVVQTVFMRLWEKRSMMDVHTSWKSYLYRAVYHEALNVLKHKQVRERYASQHVREEAVLSNDDSELRIRLFQALGELPEKCRAVFQLSRFEELKYHEIATQLGISIKTVEAHMGKALKTLRVRLAEFISCSVFILINF